MFLDISEKNLGLFLKFSWEASKLIMCFSFWGRIWKILRNLENPKKFLDVSEKPWGKLGTCWKSLNF